MARRWRAALAALALAAQLGRTAAAAAAAAATPLAASPPPAATAANASASGAASALGGKVVMDVLVTGLTTYNLTVQADIQAAFASVASSAVPGVTDFTASEVGVTATSYAAYAAVTLQGVPLTSWTGAPLTTCFVNAVVTATGVTASAVSVRVATAASAGTVVPFYVYSTTSAKAVAFEAQLAALGTPAGSASMVASLAACSLTCPGVLLDAPPTVAAYLTISIAMPPSAGPASDAPAVVAALSRTTPFVLAMRSAGLPNTAAVTITTPPVYSAVVPPPMVTVKSAPASAAAGRGVAAALAVAAAATLLAMLP